MAEPLFKNYLEIIDHQCKKYTSKDLYVFYTDGEKTIEKVTYGELLSKAYIIAANLQSCVNKGEKILILCPPGGEFNLSFAGCLFAGMIPVPLYPPDTRSFDRVINITKDCSAKAAIATSNTIDKINNSESSSSFDEFKKIQLFDCGLIQQDKNKKYNPVQIKPSEIAYLQYTSGSTSKPKGVMVTHENLIYNTHYIADYFRQTDKEYTVSWIPPFHDMGLIKDLITTIYTGSTLVFMSPYSFLRKPIRWLKVISTYGKFKPVISGGPNFAYDLCNKTISEDQLNELDLSNWKIAYNGSEPVRPTTLDAFYKIFKKCGLKKKALEPVYGLAEATLMVGGPLFGNEPLIQTLDKEDFKQNKVTILPEPDNDKGFDIPCCGRIIDEQETLIVNPDTFTVCKSNEVGEIWIKGPSVTAGYYKNKEETEKTFHAYLTDSRGPYLRTGDLGFIQDRKIYITGRLKDLIIINGHNHYPQDIELTIGLTHDALRANSTIAFSISKDDTEKLVLICGTKRTELKQVDPNDLKQKIREAIFQTHSIQVYDIVLIDSSTIPKTSSGKLQRKLCKKQYLENSLKRIIDESTKEKITV